MDNPQTACSPERLRPQLTTETQAEQMPLGDCPEGVMPSTVACALHLQYPHHSCLWRWHANLSVRVDTGEEQRPCPPGAWGIPGRWIRLDDNGDISKILGAHPSRAGTPRKPTGEPSRCFKIANNQCVKHKDISWMKAQCFSNPVNLTNKPLSISGVCFISLVLGTEPRILGMLAKHSTTVLIPATPTPP